MHAAFPRLLHASAFSLLLLCKYTRKGSTMCTANKNKPACSDPWRSDSQACSVPKALRKWQYICRWLLSITILQLPQDKTEGAQSALIKWQFTRCKYLRILGRAFHKALPWPMRPRRAPAEFERKHRIISVFFGFEPEFVEERSLHLFCFGWLPLMRAVAQCRSPSNGFCYNIHRYFLTWVFVFLLSLIVACCLVFVKTSLQACVAGCFHLQWHSLFVSLYGWSLSAPSAPSCLRFLLPPKDKKRKER